jgi:periplasmic protein TonB
MFEDSLIESTRHIAKRRGWTTLVSTSIQIVLMALLIVLPLLRTNAISSRRLSTPVLAYISAPTPMTGSHRPSGAADSGSKKTAIIEMVQPRSIPRRIVFGSDPVGRQAELEPPCLIGCGNVNGVNHGIGDLPLPIASPPPPPKRSPIISKFDPGQVIRRVEPPYPPLARVARVQGLVQLHAIISRAGVIEKLEVVSGNPLLDKAALDAVSQWRFRPYILNGQPIEVETEITVNFILDR